MKYLYRDERHNETENPDELVYYYDLWVEYAQSKTIAIMSITKAQFDEMTKIPMICDADKLYKIQISLYSDDEMMLVDVIYETEFYFIIYDKAAHDFIYLFKNNYEYFIDYSEDNMNFIDLL